MYLVIMERSDMDKGDNVSIFRGGKEPFRSNLVETLKITLKNSDSLWVLKQIKVILETSEMIMVEKMLSEDKDLGQRNKSKRKSILSRSSLIRVK